MRVSMHTAGYELPLPALHQACAVMLVRGASEVAEWDQPALQSLSSWGASLVAAHGKTINSRKMIRQRTLVSTADIRHPHLDLARRS